MSAFPAPGARRLEEHPFPWRPPGGPPHSKLRPRRPSPALPRGSQPDYRNGSQPTAGSGLGLMGAGSPCGRGRLVGGVTRQTLTSRGRYLRVQLPDLCGGLAMAWSQNSMDEAKVKAALPMRPVVASTWSLGQRQYSSLVRWTPSLADGAVRRQSWVTVTGHPEASVTPPAIT